MKFSLRFLQLAFLCLIYTFVSCSKDNDVFNEMIFQEDMEDRELEAQSGSADESDDSSSEEESGEEDSSSTDEESSETEEESGTSDDATTDATADTDAETPVEEEPVEEVTFSDAVHLGELKAFPLAEGFGKYATGGRGGSVVEVTNLNDSGSGSLRAALEMTGPRTIVFKVAGNIELNSLLKIGPDNGDVTIAGQTAPGDGITVKNHGIRIEGSNTIVRYIRFRPGDNSNEGEDAVTVVAYSGRTTKDVVIDHCSISWGKDENFNVGGIGDGSRVENVTIQNSIIAENIDTGYGVLLWNRARNITFFKNLLAHNKSRNIRSSTCTSSFEMVNNVVYGFSSACQPTYENEFDVVGNVFLSNPNTQVNASHALKLEASLNNCPDGKSSLTSAYVADNSYDGGEFTVETELKAFLEGSRVIASDIAPLSQSQVQNAVLNDVGASLSRDSHDARIVNDVKNRTGKIPSSVSDAGGYPSLSGGTAYEDKDKDGMADAWEEANGLNPDDAQDGSNDRNSDGFTNLEEFLFSLES